MNHYFFTHDAHGYGIYFFRLKVLFFLVIHLNYQFLHGMNVGQSAPEESQAFSARLGNDQEVLNNQDAQIHQDLDDNQEVQDIDEMLSCRLSLYDCQSKEYKGIPLHEAVLHEDIDAVCYYIKKAAATAESTSEIIKLINSLDQYGRSPLLIASYYFIKTDILNFLYVAYYYTNCEKFILKAASV